ncbi:hypothetical protein PMAYCL1PPCAC_17463 [Pristionchus mayeri]|uniref:SXP/RAL-2 family protein Ani s 5-like cation-binding domain-containing protein n=1 Tax=Pristionchus mayeri TaxID=1317129 RepID=A0AAN5CMP6_9BILA|nr:hypothetical protein PMAYCL1PPCAC_17463 [Pristionchus mayeri]
MRQAVFLLVALTLADAVFFAKSMQKKEKKEEFRPKLPFFANCTSEEIREFFSITRNKSLPKKEVEERTREWAEERGNETLVVYTEYIAELKKRKENAFLVLKQVFNKLPEMLERYDEAREDMDITGEEEEKKLARILNAYSLETRNAFVYLITHHYPRGVNDTKRKPFIPSPRKNGENRNKGPYGKKEEKIPVEEEAL